MQSLVLMFFVINIFVKFSKTEEIRSQIYPEKDPINKL